MITVTEAAAKKALELAAKEGAPKQLRVGVRGGGCSGYSYVLKFTDDTREGDEVLECGELKVVVDPKSLRLLDGTELDFESNLLSGGFRLKNPQAKRTCSCGDSFTL